MTNFETGSIREVDIESEMRSSYLDYAMSVIVSRALPDVRDGLKPVQRRILYAMYNQGITAGSKTVKCATIVGEVLGKYHPHGDSSVYDALVRLAQEWVVRYPLVHPQGNFGNIDGDTAAAYRYTEAKMSQIAMQLTEDIDKNTVDFGDNFSNTEKEPLVLPALLPNMIVNGASGIAVGMATNIPPHNLGEVADGIIHLIDDPEITTEDLCKYIKGPDFPTGGIIYAQDIPAVYATGHGKLTVRAQVDFEESASGREQIIIRELPYQVNKARLMANIAELVNDRKIEGINDLRDESGREDTVRIVIELKQTARPRTVLNNLYKHTQLQTTFGVIMLALVDGRPQVLSLKAILHEYLTHRRSIVTRRTQYELDKAKDRAHILEGLQICLKHLDEVIEIIRRAPDEQAAKSGLEQRFGLSERQSQAIVDLRLGRLTRLEADKVQQEYEELIKKIAYFEGVLADPKKVDAIIREEVTELRKKFADPRKTEIRLGESSLNDEDLIPREDVFVTLTHRGYIKRMPVNQIKAQHRGGKGVVGAKRSNDEDYVEHSTIANTHNDLLFFTNKGRVFRLRTHEIPDVKRQAKGLPIINLIDIDANEKITSLIEMQSDSQEQYLAMATRLGMIKKTPVGAFSAVRRNGLIAMNLQDNDELNWVRLSSGNDEYILVTRSGKSARFSEKLVRPMGRDTMGVSAMRLTADDELAGFDIVIPDGYVFVVTENGYGKLTPMPEYPSKGRNIQGVYTLEYKAIPKIGKIIGMKVLASTEGEVLVISTLGQLIRLPFSQVRITGRQTKGVILIRLADWDKVGSIAEVGVDEED
ncbi:MAG: DNA gyrase subunit A [Candidatus Dormibacteria bacterium]